MQDIKAMVAKAKAAQKIYEDFTQEQYDLFAKTVGKLVFDNAEMFAKEAVAETGMGTVESKIAKKTKITKGTWLQMKGRPSKGVVGWEKGKLSQDCILKIARPVGVIGAILPTTNPVSTVASNGMMALKAGNAIIFCPHPKAKNVSLHCYEMLKDALAELGAPDGLIQMLDEPSVEATQEVIANVDLVVATGGPGMVKAAYSSGHPAIGVGQGNCQVVVDRGMTKDFEKLTTMLIANRSYDNGIPCTGEQTVIVPEEDTDAMFNTLEKNGAYIIKDTALVDKLRDTLFVKKPNGDDYMLDRGIVGLTPQKLGEKLGIEVPEGKKLIAFTLSNYGAGELLCREKLCPVTGVYSYSGDWKEAIGIARANLEVEGAGHSSDIYTDSEENQIYAGEQLPVCRIIVNAGNSTVGGANYDNGLYTTGTLGCGYWGGSSIDVGVTFEHMLNYSRLYYIVPAEKEVPSDEEAWA